MKSPLLESWQAFLTPFIEKQVKEMQEANIDEKSYNIRQEMDKTENQAESQVRNGPESDGEPL